MNRRQALKNLGLGAGFLVVGPTTFGLLQSCKNEPDFDWQPSFLSAANGFALKEILEVILPSTDTPGANDLNLARFIDSYMDQVAPEERQKNFSQNADHFAQSFQSTYDKEIGEGTTAEFDEMVKEYLKTTPAEGKRRVERETETQDPLNKDPEEVMKFQEGSRAYLQEVRDLGIWAWKTSEEIGENVMWYDPIPGMYIPCATTEELGNNGKAMSL
jgi:hypothetical protein